jgi:hypothetical protein
MDENYMTFGYSFFKFHCLQFNVSSTPTIGLAPIMADEA